MSEHPVIAPDARVLTLDAVRWGIDELKKPKIHRHFFAYLFLCRSASVGDRDDIHPVWHDLEPYIRLHSTQHQDDQEKPYYLPIASQNVRDQSTYWLNDNLAGSYAPSSGRPNGLSFARQGKKFRLPVRHGALALQALLGGTPVPAAPVAAYLLRNQAFPSTAENAQDLVDAFADHFGFKALADGQESFNELFAPEQFPSGLSPTQENNSYFQWFEDFSAYRSRPSAGETDNHGQ